MSIEIKLKQLFLTYDHVGNNIMTALDEDGMVWVGRFTGIEGNIQWQRCNNPLPTPEVAQQSEPPPNT